MIRYHGLPITPNNAAMWIAKCFGSVMVSYAHPDQMDIALQWGKNIALDNGAFSAWESGKKYDFQGFWLWASHYYRHPAIRMIVAPDVIDGTEAENDELLKEAMRRLPKAPWIPVWHMHESLDRLLRLLEYDRIAIGSSGEYADLQTRCWWQRITEAMGTCCDAEGYPLRPLHGLRQMDPTIFSHIPYASVDSTGIGHNVGIDKKWPGPYAPKSKWVRAIVLADRAETHASATRWSGSAGVSKNLELFG
jgi:hypothetical protein